MIGKEEGIKAGQARYGREVKNALDGMPAMNIYLKETLIPGVADLTVDQEVTIELKVKVTGVSRDTWSDRKEISVSADVISGAIKGE